jgi:hypothetical protein
VLYLLNTYKVQTLQAPPTATVMSTKLLSSAETRSRDTASAEAAMNKQRRPRTRSRTAGWMLRGGQTETRCSGRRPVSRVLSGSRGSRCSAKATTRPGSTPVHVQALFRGAAGAVSAGRTQRKETIRSTPCCACAQDCSLISYS